MARVGRALASPVRVRMLDLLRQGPRSVETLAAWADVGVANASQHLKVLRGARLVDAQKDAHRVVYRLTEASVSAFFGATRDLAEVLLPEMDRLRRDFGVLDDAARAELFERIREDRVTLVDVRPIEEFRAGHLEGALSMPIDELAGRLHEIPKNREVVTYCRGPYCAMALEAVSLLTASGYRAIHLDLGPADVRFATRRLRVVEGEPASAVSPTARKKPKKRNPR